MLTMIRLVLGAGCLIGALIILHMMPSQSRLSWIPRTIQIGRMVKWYQRCVIYWQIL